MRYPDYETDRCIDPAKIKPKLKPYGWGIVDKDGKPYFSTDCVAQHPEDLRQTIEYLNESEGDEDHRAPWRVVQLFYKEES